MEATARHRELNRSELERNRYALQLCDALGPGFLTKFADTLAEYRQIDQLHFGILVRNTILGEVRFAFVIGLVTATRNPV